mmetsp:Transcript_74883/g.242115  ORF Transcript_74883/g.242115 Transcript_74883/m.242115 type:complete len:146 (-) Transcript_74883:795-1232(-)
MAPVRTFTTPRFGEHAAPRPLQSTTSHVARLEGLTAGQRRPCAALPQSSSAARGCNNGERGEAPAEPGDCGELGQLAAGGDGMLKVLWCFLARSSVCTKGAIIEMRQTGNEARDDTAIAMRATSPRNVTGKSSNMFDETFGPKIK